jgi:hypothetical protein
MSKEYEKGEDTRAHAPRQVNRVGRERVGNGTIARPSNYVSATSSSDAKGRDSVIRYPLPSRIQYAFVVSQLGRLRR